MKPGTFIRKNFRQLIYTSLAGVGIIILASFLIESHIFQNGDAFISLNLPILVVAIIFTHITIILKIFRWKYICGVYGVPITFREAGKITIGSFFIAGISPGRVGDIIKADIMKIRYSLSYVDGISMVFYDRIFELIAILTVAGGIFLIGFSARYYLLFEATILILIFIGIVYVFSDRLIGVVQRFVQKRIKHLSKAGEIKIRKLPIFSAFTVFTLTGLALVSEFIRFWLVVYAFGYSVNIIPLSIFFSLAVLIGLISQIPLGVGVVEGSLILFLVDIGIPPANATAIVIVDRVIAMYYVLILGLLYYSLILKSYLHERDGLSNNPDI
jgi:glycosyltransferase 2 family protein